MSGFTYTHIVPPLKTRSIHILWMKRAGISNIISQWKSNVEESQPFLSFTRLFESTRERKRDFHRTHSQWIKMRLYLFVEQPVEPSSVRQQEVHTSSNVCQSKHRPLLIFKRNQLLNKRWTYQTETQIALRKQKVFFRYNQKCKAK